MMNDKMGFALLPLLLAAAVGCGDDSGSGGSAAGGNGTGGDGTGGDGGAAADPSAPYYECEESAFYDAKPMSGPGLADDGSLIGEPQATYFVSTTQIYVSEEQRDAFFGLAGDVIVQLADTPGLVGYALGGDDACHVNRTLGVWESEEAMYAFVASGAHVSAMGQVGEVSITGKTAHWTASAEEVQALTWDDARARLEDVEPLDTYE